MNKLHNDDQVQSIPFQITFRDFETSDFVWLAIQERIENLERYKMRATKCQVVVSKPHRSSSHGQIYHIEIRLHIPGRDVFISREPERNESHTDIYVAIRDAFDCLERQIEDFMKIRRGYVKNHMVTTPLPPREPEPKTEDVLLPSG